MLRTIVEAEYAVPAGQTVEALTAPLLAALGSPDPALREPVPEIIDVWIERGLYAPPTLRTMAAQMVDNLAVGLGEQDTDSVFLRAFSLLVLTSIVNRDILQPFFDASEVHALLGRVLAYAGTERDLRGFVPGYGWAHAAAHTGDLLWVLASHRDLDARALERILDTIAALVAPSDGHVYLHNEEERLVHATLGVFSRRLVSWPVVQTWLDRLVRPDGRDLGPEIFATLSQPNAGIRHNTVAFLRALYFQVAGLTYEFDALPAGLPMYIADQLRDAPQLAGETLPGIVTALRAISVF